jgi:flagellin
MLFSIQTNVSAANATQNLSRTSEALANSLKRLSSGLRSTLAGDDASGLTASEKYRGEIATLTQGIRNQSDAVSTLHIVDGGLSTIGVALNRMTTLATQAASGEFEGDRTALNQELQSLTDAINQDAAAIGLDEGGDRAKDLKVFVGSTATGDGTVSIDLSKATVDAKSLGLTTTVDNKTVPALDISTQEGAEAALKTLAAAAAKVDDAQQAVAAGEGSIIAATAQSQADLIGRVSAESRIRDADLAAESATQSKTQILQQAGMAALAQANSAPMSVLSLLRA